MLWPPLILSDDGNHHSSSAKFFLSFISIWGFAGRDSDRIFQRFPKYVMLARVDGTAPIYWFIFRPCASLPFCAIWPRGDKYHIRPISINANLRRILLQNIRFTYRWLWLPVTSTHQICTELQCATNSWLQQYPKLMHRLSVAGHWAAANAVLTVLTHAISCLSSIF